MSNKIEIVRGTTNTFQIEVRDANGVLYTVVAGEKIIFGIKEKPTDAELILAKSCSFQSVGSYLATLSPEDTANLEPGRYFYDVALQSGKNFYNIIEPMPFIIQPNVTKWGCAD